MEELILHDNQMKTNIPEKEESLTVHDSIVGAEGVLLDKWLDSFEGSAVFPTINGDQWRALLHEAQNTGKEILLVGVGCPAWAEVVDTSGNLKQFLRDLPRKGRPLRFARGLASFQRALESFGVRVTPVLTLSTVEALMRWKVGSERVMSDRAAVEEMIESSQRTMSELLQDQGCRAVFFDHIDFIARENDCDTEGVLDGVTSEHEMREFGRNLIRRDIQKMPEEAMEFVADSGSDPVGVIWLDMMAEKAEKERRWVVEATEGLDSNLPVIAPFKNVSRWAARAVTQESFLTKADFASEWLGVDTPGKVTRATWLRQVLVRSDGEIEAKLRSLDVEVQIGSMRDKNKAVEMIERIVFGESSFVDGRIVQDVVAGKADTMLAIVSSATDQARNHIRGLAEEGRIRVNDVVIRDVNQVVGNGDLIQVGKKIVLRVVDVDPCS